MFGSFERNGKENCISTVFNVVKLLKFKKLSDQKSCMKMAGVPPISLG